MQENIYWSIFSSSIGTSCFPWEKMCNFMMYSLKSCLVFLFVQYVQIRYVSMFLASAHVVNYIESTFKVLAYTWNSVTPVTRQSQEPTKLTEVLHIPQSSLFNRSKSFNEQKNLYAELTGHKIQNLLDKNLVSYTRAIWAPFIKSS
jgi:hypothetical protein